MDSTRTGERAKKAPPDASTVHSTRTCVCREVPVDHAAHSEAQLRQVETTQLWRECTPEAEADHEARMQPHSGLRQERTMSGMATLPQLWDERLPRAARGGRKWCW